MSQNMPMKAPSGSASVSLQSAQTPPEPTVVPPPPPPEPPVPLVLDVVELALVDDGEPLVVVSSLEHASGDSSNNVMMLRAARPCMASSFDRILQRPDDFYARSAPDV